MNRRNKRNTAFLTQSGAIAAVYVLLTMLSASLGLASGEVQLRLSEALTILPCFTAAAVPGLFLGCLLSNLLSGCLFWDVVLGSLATLLGAAGTRLLRKNRWLACLPPILANALILPFVLAWAYGIPGGIPWLMLTVGVGEALSCGVLGQLLWRALDRHKEQLFKN